MRLNSVFNILATTILVLCAMVVTSILVRHELVPSGSRTEPVFIENWRALLSGGHTVGDTSALVYVIEFSDYQCPYCKTMEPVIERVLKKYQGLVTLVRYDLPLRSHPHALEAALAVECASLQQRYDQYHDLLFEYPEHLNEGEWVRLALLAGVRDTARFRQCIRSNEQGRSVDHEINVAKRFAVQGTPTFVVNGFVLIGAVEEPVLESMIERILSELRQGR